MDKPKKTTRKTKIKKRLYYYGLGRRRRASARVRIYLVHEDKGKIVVNDKPIKVYFPGEENKKYYQEPLRTCNVVDQYYISAKVTGSGKRGQLGAFIHGLARALVLIDPENNRIILKKRGFLTRDPRKRERRKVGTGGKARRQKQSPKR